MKIGKIMLKKANYLNENVPARVGFQSEWLSKASKRMELARGESDIIRAAPSTKQAWPGRF